SQEAKKRSKLSKTETLKELNFDLKSSKEPRVKSEKLYRKKKSKSSSNVREFHKQRFKISKSNSNESNFENKISSPSLRTVKSSDSLEKTEYKKYLISSTSSLILSKCKDSD